MTSNISRREYLQTILSRYQSGPKRAESFWERRRMADLRYFGETAKIKATTSYLLIPSTERDTNPMD